MSKSPANIEVTVVTQHIEEQSDADNERYVFAYTITIKHNGGLPCQLLNRHWLITDGSGHIEEVRGEGVVGVQPKLAPGESYEYTSGAILKTPVGAMHGEYGFVTEAGEHFEVAIAPFSLSIPSLVH